MKPVLLVALLWALFVISHIGLATAPVRSRLVAALGPVGFTWLYTAVASVTFTALSVGFAAVRHDGPRGLDLAAEPWVRGVLTGVSVGAIALMISAFAPRAYWKSPIVVFGEGVRAPFGLERISRHPFFAGLAMLMSAHVLLASRATAAVMCAGFVVLSTVGAAHQGAKLRQLRGPAYDRFLAETSAVPMWAIVRGRQRLVLGELPWAAMAVGVAVGFALREIHGNLFAWRGAAFALVVSGSAVVIGAIATALARRRTMTG